MKHSNIKTACLILVISILQTFFLSGCSLNSVFQIGYGPEDKSWDSELISARASYEQTVRKKVFENFPLMNPYSASGDIFVSFEVFPDGKLFEPSIQFLERASKDKCLRQAAIEIIKKSSPFPAIPEQLRNLNKNLFVIFLPFRSNQEESKVKVNTISRGRQIYELEIKNVIYGTYLYKYFENVVGDAYVSFVLNSDGSLKESSIKIENTSAKDKALRQAVIEILKDSAPFPPFPDNMKSEIKKKWAQFNIVLSFNEYKSNDVVFNQVASSQYNQYYQKIGDILIQAIHNNCKSSKEAFISLWVTLLSSGEIKDVRVDEYNSDASDILIESAIKSVKGASPLPAFPYELQSSFSELEFNYLITLKFKK